MQPAMMITTSNNPSRNTRATKILDRRMVIVVGFTVAQDLIAVQTQDLTAMEALCRGVGAWEQAQQLV